MVKTLDGRKLRTGARNHAFKHGLFGTPEHRSWVKMRRRCRDKKNNRYAQYGGRGITVCERWQDFTVFLQDMGPKPSPRHTIDRRDNDLGYFPDNCRWADYQTQERNRTNNRILSLAGISKTLVEWAESASMEIGTLWQRLDRGWSLEKALATPVRKLARR